MTVAYLFRLLCLSSACFVAVHVTLSAVIISCSSTLCRQASRLSPSLAANLCFAARVLPSAAAFLFVSAVCIPSYLEWEPWGAAESIGLLCFSAASLGLLFCAHALLRTARALVATLRFHRVLSAGNIRGPQVALAGIVAPRIIISDIARATLSVPQLALVVRHEKAHHSQCDNLKRFLLMLTPSWPPFCGSGFAQLERSWANFAEWAADDSAATTYEDSLTLADALVCIARLQRESSGLPALWTSFLADGQDLAPRVERLLLAAGKPSTARSALILYSTAVLIALPAVLGCQVWRSGSLKAVHRVLEFLIQ